MSEKVSERTKILEIIHDMLDRDIKRFSVYSLRHAYNARYALNERGKMDFAERAESWRSRLPEGANKEYTYLDYVSGRSTSYDSYEWYYDSELKKESVHFSYYIKKFVKEGIVEEAGRTGSHGRRKFYTIPMNVRAIAKMRATKTRGKALKRERRKAPLTVELRRNGNVVPVENVETFYTTYHVFAGKGEFLREVATLTHDEKYYSYGNSRRWDRGSTRSWVLKFKNDEGKINKRRYSSAESALKAVAYRKLKGVTFER